jgi:RNA polymerase sporulation-specific sigma factor
MNNFERQEIQEFAQHYKKLFEATVPLSLQEERTLAEVMQKAKGETTKQHPNKSVMQAGEEARDRFIRSNIRLIAYVMRRFGNLQSMTKQDLFHEGVIGLIKAIDSFDPDRSVKFSSFAIPVIKNAMISAIFNNDRLIRLPPYRENQLRDHMRKEAGVENAEIEQDILVRVVLSLDFPTTEDDSKATLAESLAGDDFAEAMSTRLTIEDLATTILEGLTPLERQIVLALFFEDVTGAELARQSGVSRMRIIQRKQKILQKLKEFVDHLGITSADLFD